MSKKLSPCPESTFCRRCGNRIPSGQIACKDMSVGGWVHSACDREATLASTRKRDRESKLRYLKEKRA